MPSAGFEPAVPATDQLAPDRSGRCDTATVRDGRTDSGSAGTEGGAATGCRHSN